MTNSETADSQRRKVGLPISIVLLMAIIACQSRNENQLVAKRIEFNYSYLDTLYSSHWLKLDDITSILIKLTESSNYDSDEWY